MEKAGLNNDSRDNCGGVHLQVKSINKRVKNEV